MKKDKFKRTRRKDKDLDGFPRRKKFCRFCKDKTYDINYKNTNVLERMVGEKGKILGRRFTGNCARHQRKVSAAVKMARYFSLLPHVK